MKPSHLMSLYRLAELGAHKDEIAYTTGKMAEAMGWSQQTASRHLIQMEEEGLITRSIIGRKQKIRITSRGLDQLMGMHQVLTRALDTTKQSLMIRGTVFTGLAEGSYYVGLEGYRKQFRSKLGFDPYPGTLNLRVLGEDLNARRRLEASHSVYIEGFANERRTYGPANCYIAVVNDKLEAAVIVPIRAHYGEDVIELISKHQLRKQLKLKDGDMVRVKVAP